MKKKDTISEQFVQTLIIHTTVPDCSLAGFVMYQEILTQLLCDSIIT